MGKNIENLDIKVKMTPIGSLEEQMKLELLKMQSEVLDGLGDIMTKYSLPREAWVETIFKRYMHLPDDIVNVFLTALPSEVEAGEANESTAPTTKKIIQELEGSHGSSKFKNIAKQIREVADSGAPVEGAPKKMRISEVIHQPKLKDPDIVISSFGKHPFELKRSSDSITESTGTQTKYSMRAKTASNAKWDDDKSTAESIPESEAAPPVKPKEPAYRKYI